MNWWQAALARKMNDSGGLPQEKMELDLEIPSSLVQTDGHLRRSNSAPMINGLRFYTMTVILQWSLCEYVNVLFHSPRSKCIILMSRRHMRHMVDLWIFHCSDNSQVFQREVLRSRRNSTTVVNRPNMVHCFIKQTFTQVNCVWIVLCWMFNSPLHSSFFTGPFITHSCPQHQTSSD